MSKLIINVVINGLVNPAHQLYNFVLCIINIQYTNLLLAPLLSTRKLFSRMVKVENRKCTSKWEL